MDRPMQGTDQDDLLARTWGESTHQRIACTLTKRLRVGASRQSSVAIRTGIAFVGVSRARRRGPGSCRRVREDSRTNRGRPRGREDEMKLREVMGPSVPVASPDESATAAWERMQATQVDCMVVTRDDAILGTLSWHA